MQVDTFLRRGFLKPSGLAPGSDVFPGAGLFALNSSHRLIDWPEVKYGANKMSKKILITYASVAGSTARVAEAIGKTLAEDGIQVEALLMKNVKDLSPYSAVVAGSAIHGQKWLPEAMQFMHEHRSVLASKPFAAFMVCITLSMKDADQYREGLKSWMSPVRELVHPASEGYFAGALDFSRLPFSFNVLAMRFVVLTGMWKAGDHLDRKAIHNWAKSLSPLLLQ